jgi:hypothetical protein
MFTEARVKGRRLLLVCAWILVISICAYTLGSTVPGVLSPWWSGRWQKVTGDRTHSDELTLIRTWSGTVKLKSWDSQHFGVNSVTLRCDGAEHLYETSYNTQTTYHAQCDRNSIVVTKHEKFGLFPEEVYTEQWNATNHGSELIVTGTTSQASYRRPSWLQRLMTSGP